MFAFREAAREGDAASDLEKQEDGVRVLADRSSVFRRGAAEKTLRDDLVQDLGTLVDTIDLGSIIDLSNKKYVAGSVLNYGLHDFSHLSTDSLRLDEIGNNLEQSLLRHEPRLRPESIVVERREDSGRLLNGQLSFAVSAEMRANPVDIPVEFVAQLDVGSGKVCLPEDKK